LSRATRHRQAHPQPARRGRALRLGAAVVLVIVLVGAAAALIAPDASGRLWRSARQAIERLLGGGGPAASYVEALGGEPAGLNPLLHLDAPSQQVSSLLFCGLTVLDGAGNVLPGLATSWQASNGNRTWTFSLRNDAVWHDGQPLTARDVTFTLNSLASADFPGDVRGEWQGVSARYTNDYTVIVDLPLPETSFATRAAVAILPRHILSSVPFVQWLEHAFSRAPVGCGPYAFDEWQEGRELLLQANQRYFLGAPRIEEIRLRFFPVAATGGGVDVAAFTGSDAATGGRVAPAVAAEVARQRGVTVERYPSSVFCSLVPNHRRVAGEQAVRLAIHAALDVERILAAAGIPAMTVGGPFVPGAVSAAAQPEAGRRNLTEARRLLADAGWRDANSDGVLERQETELRFGLLIPTGRDDLAAAAAEIARQLGECGMAVQVEALSLSDYLAHWASPFDWDLMLVEWVSQPDADLFEMLHSSQQPVRGAGDVLRGGANIAGVSDQQLDALLAGVRATADTEPNVAARAGLYAALCDRWATQSPQVVLWRVVEFYAHSAGLTGVAPGPYGIYWNIHAWEWR